MIKTVVLLIVASKGYQPIEFGHTRDVLKKAGVKVVVASPTKLSASGKPSPAHAKDCDDEVCTHEVAEHPGYATTPVDVLLKDVNASDYQGIFIIGGPGALDYLDNDTTYTIMQNAAKAGMPFGAICISPRILAHAGLLKGKKVTGWNEDGELPGVLRDAGAIYTKNPVVTDGKIVTADGPASAKAFGEAILKVMK